MPGSTNKNINGFTLCAVLGLFIVAMCIAYKSCKWLIDAWIAHPYVVYCVFLCVYFVRVVERSIRVHKIFKNKQQGCKSAYSGFLLNVSISSVLALTFVPVCYSFFDEHMLAYVATFVISALHGCFSFTFLMFLPAIIV